MKILVLFFGMILCVCSVYAAQGDELQTALGLFHRAASTERARAINVPVVRSQGYVLRSRFISSGENPSFAAVLRTEASASASAAAPLVDASSGRAKEFDALSQARLAGRKRERVENCDTEELKELAKQQVPDEDTPERDSKRAIIQAPRLDGQSGMSSRVSDLNLAAQSLKPVDQTVPLIVTLNRLMPKE